MLLINIIAIGLQTSYAYFQVNVIKKSVVVIKTAVIKMSIESQDLTNNKTLSLAAGESKTVTLTITNESEHDALARLYYIGDITDITFQSDTTFKDENNIPIGRINKGQSQELTLTITNNTESNTTIELGAQEGLIGYDLPLYEGRNSKTLVVPQFLVDRFREVLTTRTSTTIVDEEDGITYISGAADDYNATTTDDIDFNYVWYSGKLWRITSVNSDGTMKMITNDAITSISWGLDKTFETSWVREWLNQEFLPTLNNYEDIIVTDYRWNATTTTSSTIKPPETTMITDSVGLLNSYEYYKSYEKLGTDSTAVGSGYLNIDYFLWLITPNSNVNMPVYTWPDKVVEDSSSFYFPSTGFSFKQVELSNSNFGVRPTINLKSIVEFNGGDGSYNNPYTLKGDVEEIIAGTTLLNTRESGEYVKIENDSDATRMFRIVGTELIEEKLTTKLVLNDYLKENDVVITKSFSNDSTYGDGTTNDYWDYYLNNTYLSTLNNSMLERGTYYLGKYPDATSYKATVCNSIDSTKSVSTCINEENVVTNTWTGYVGLLRVGEMFSSQTKDYTYENASSYWLITPYSNSNVLSVANYGHAYPFSYSKSYGVRPTINLTSTVVIKSGTGTEWDPFVVGLS